MWRRCSARAILALLGFGLLGIVTSAAAHSPRTVVPAESRPARALAAYAPNPLEEDMVALGATVPGAFSAPAPAPGPAAPAPGPAARASVRVVAAAAPAPAPAPSPAAPPAAPALSAAARAVETALKELGKPYRYGALGPTTFDCSGLTKFAYGAAGIVLPHSAAAQYGSGRRVNRNQLQPGDLIFWRGLGHVGMYIGGGRMVHAPQTGDVVTITSIDQGAYLGAVRPGA
jgi:cell wall-associated NlpC family hydrolase